MEIRAVVHFLWKKGQSNKEILSDVSDVYGDDSTTLRTIQRWTKRFKSGDESLNEQTRSGRPENPDLTKKVQELMETDPFISQKKIC